MVAAQWKACGMGRQRVVNVEGVAGCKSLVVTWQR